MTVWRWYDGWWERPIHRRWPEEKEKRGGSHSEHCVTDGAQPTQAYTSKVAKSRCAACTAPTDGIFCIKARLPLWSLGWKSAVMAASPIKWPPHLFYDWPHSILSNFSSIFYRCCCCHYNISDHFSPLLLYSFWVPRKRERREGYEISGRAQQIKSLQSIENLARNFYDPAHEKIWSNGYKQVDTLCIFVRLVIIILYNASNACCIYIYITEEEEWRKDQLFS